MGIRCTKVWKNEVGTMLHLSESKYDQVHVLIYTQEFMQTVQQMFIFVRLNLTRSSLLSSFQTQRRVRVLW